LLLAHPKIDVNLCARGKNAPLWVACRENHHLIVKALLESRQVTKLQLNVKNLKNRTPFYAACRNGCLETLRLLLREPDLHVNEAKNGATAPFFAACEGNHPEVVKLLLEHHLQVQAGAFQQELCDLNRPILKISPFYVCCYKGHAEIVKLLLADSHGRIDINAKLEDGQTPFAAGCIAGHLDVVKILGSDPRIDKTSTDNKGFSPFHVVCCEGHLEIAQWILENQSLMGIQIDLNLRTVMGSNPFYLAACDGQFGMIRFLLNQDGVDRNVPNLEGLTPFNAACQLGNDEVIKLLLDIDEVDVNRPDNDSSTPLGGQSIGIGSSDSYFIGFSSMD